MSVVSPPTPPPTRPPAAPARSRRLWWVLGAIAVAVVLIVVAALIVTRVAGGNEALTRGYGDPQNPAPQGSRALAQVIDDHGVDVEIVRDSDELADADRPGPDTTVVVSGTGAFHDQTAQSFRERVADARRVVLLGPSSDALETLGIFAQLDTRSVSGSLPADCTVPGIDPSDAVTAGDLGYISPQQGAVGCFAVDGVASILFLPPSLTLPETVLVDEEMLLNGNLTEADNAGVAIRTIAATDRVLWYIPSRFDQLEAESEGTPDIPRALGPLIALAFVLLIVAMFWRGRRFGPLVTEPLPAVVKAIETTQARGRMYQRARASSRAAATLRIRTLGSLAAYLGLPYDASRATDALSDPDSHPPDGRVSREERAAHPPDGRVSREERAAHPPDGRVSREERAAHRDPAIAPIAEAVVRVTGRDPATVFALLAGPLPTTDRDLATFAHDLTALEQEVRHRP